MVRFDDVWREPRELRTDGSRAPWHLFNITSYDRKENNLAETGRIGPHAERDTKIPIEYSVRFTVGIRPRYERRDADLASTLAAA